MAHEKLVLTYQDYLQMPDDRNRRELLGGDLYVTPAPSPAHQRVVLNLVSRLDDHARRHGLGKVYPAPVDVVLSQVDVVQPDAVFVRAERLHIVTETSIQGAPDLVAEVFSPSTQQLDRGGKMQTYARFGVQEYWIVDLEARALEVYRLESDRFRPAASSEAPGGSASALPGLVLNVQNLWG